MKVLLLLTIISYITAQGKFNYKDLYHSGPACSDGRMQSPINLTESQSLFNATINLLSDTYSPLKNVRIQFNERLCFITDDSQKKWGFHYKYSHDRKIIP